MYGGVDKAKAAAGGGIIIVVIIVVVLLIISSGVGGYIFYASKKKIWPFSGSKSTPEPDIAGPTGNPSPTPLPTPLPIPTPQPTPTPTPTPTPKPIPVPSPPGGSSTYEPDPDTCRYDPSSTVKINVPQLTIYGEMRGGISWDGAPFKKFRVDDLDTRVGYNNLDVGIDGADKTCNALDLSNPNELIIIKAYKDKDIAFLGGNKARYDGKIYTIYRV